MEIVFIHCTISKKPESVFSLVLVLPDEILSTRSARGKMTRALASLGNHCHQTTGTTTAGEVEILVFSFKHTWEKLYQRQYLAGERESAMRD